jgi:hypothetical protein
MQNISIQYCCDEKSWVIQEDTSTKEKQNSKNYSLYLNRLHNALAYNEAINNQTNLTIKKISLDFFSNYKIEHDKKTIFLNFVVG